MLSADFHSGTVQMDFGIVYNHGKSVFVGLKLE